MSPAASKEATTGNDLPSAKAHPLVVEEEGRKEQRESPRPVIAPLVLPAPKPAPLLTLPLAKRQALKKDSAIRTAATWAGI